MVTVTLPPPTATLSPSPSVTMPPGGATFVNFDLHLTGVGKASRENTSPIHTNRNLTVCFYALNADPTGDSNCDKGVMKKMGDINFDSSSGNFKSNNPLNLGSIGTGQYQIFVSSNKYLRKRIPQAVTITGNSTNPVPNISLTAGDIDGNNVINIRDYNIYQSCFGNRTPTTGQCQNADLNDDGKNDTASNMSDFAWLQEAFRVQRGD